MLRRAGKRSNIIREKWYFKAADFYSMNEGRDEKK